MRRLAFLAPLALLAPAIAQNVDLTINDKTDEVLRVSIVAEFNVNQTRRILMDGEEFAGRGGRGGGRGGTGETTITQTIVFDRGPESAGWRQYVTLASATSQGGQDRQVQGALAGQRVFFRDGALYQGEGEDAEPVAANLSRGVPGRVVLAGLVKSGEIAVGDEFDISETFLPVLRGLLHPVAAQGGQRGGGGGRGGGRGGRGGGGGNAANTLSQVIASSQLGCEATGKLVSFENGVATVELSAKLTGEGTAEELGMGGGGRRGGGGGGGSGTATASINLTGTATVDVEAHQLTTMELSGDVDLNSDTTRATGRGNFQTIQGTKGTIKLTVTCEPVTN